MEQIFFEVQLCIKISIFNEFCEFSFFCQIASRRPEKDEFEIDGKTFLSYQLNSKIKYVVHSHYGSNCRPSKVDKIQCREVGIPYLIVSYPEKDYTIIQP